MLMLCAYTCVHRLRSSRKYSQTDAADAHFLTLITSRVFVMSEVRQAATDQVGEL